METGRSDFAGAKIMVFVGTDMLILERDNSKGIVWPGHLDFPGGGREQGETPEDCASRELEEELGLSVARTQMDFVHKRDVDGTVSWFFAAHLPVHAVNDVVFGGEGAGWRIMAPADYIAHPKAIPHFARILQNYLHSD